MTWPMAWIAVTATLTSLINMNIKENGERGEKRKKVTQGHNIIQVWFGFCSQGPI